MKKHFVLDTNVLLHSPACLKQFGDNTVVIPVDVIEELDKFKSGNDELGRNARAVIRALDEARGRGPLGTGAPINDEGGLVLVDLKPVCLLEDGLRDDTPDNRIVSVAYRLKREGVPVTFISKDVNMRVKADALGMAAEDFETDKAPPVDDMRLGWRSVEAERAAIEDLRRTGAATITTEVPLNPNELVLLRERGNPKNTVLGRPDLGPDRTTFVPKPEVTLRGFVSPNEPVMGIAPRNLEQRVALELLLDPDVSLITLVGKAGTGKTLLALVAGLWLTTRRHHFQKLLVSRPVMPLGRDIGFLPGTAEEKLTPWMKPIFDNIKFILRDKQPGEVERKIHDLFKSGIVEIEPLTFIRGRSIHNQFFIVDECQNLTPHQIKTIISRVGDDTKLILTGDPYQIDNPYLDSRSNGLTYVAERFKRADVAGHVLFTKSERSRLASLAVELL